MFVAYWHQVPFYQINLNDATSNLPIYAKKHKKSWHCLTCVCISIVPCLFYKRHQALRFALCHLVLPDVLQWRLPFTVLCRPVCGLALFDPLPNVLDEHVTGRTILSIRAQQIDGSDSGKAKGTAGKGLPPRTESTALSTSSAVVCDVPCIVCF